jgi:uncharacterized protein YndB with AHSA1/START domain
MTKRDEEPSLVVRRTIPLPRQRVFDAWLDPACLARFMRPSGTIQATAEVDRRVGGKFRIVMQHRQGAPTEHIGEYLLIDRPRRLSFTWQSIHTDNTPTTVTIDFLERDTSTEVVLTHYRLPPDEIENHRAGWTDIVSAVAKVA